MKPGALLDEFVRHLRVERGLSPCTWKAYGYQLRGYLRFLEARRRAPGTAVRDDVLAYLEARKDAGVSSSTVFAAAIAVRQFHRFLAERGRASSDPTAGLKLPKYRQRLPEPLSVAEMERLLAAARGSKRHLVGMYGMVEVLYSTGMRVSELVGLGMDQVDLEQSQVRVIGKGNKERILPLGPRAKEALVRYLEAREKRFPGYQGPVFLSSRGRPISRTTFWWQLRRLAARAGISGVHPHRVRHSTASHLLSGGASMRVLAELLGHSSQAVTAKYAHVSGDLVRRTTLILDAVREQGRHIGGA